MRSKLVAAAVAVVALGALVFFLSRPSAPAETGEPKPTVTKPPMVRAPPPEPAAVPTAPTAAVTPAASDASVEVAVTPDAPPAPDPLKTPKIFHHGPPPRSMGARFLALERRYDKAREAWTVVRSHKNPAEQLRYDSMLNQIGNELSAGSKQAGAAELQDFVTQALDGVEP
jgi:hypothetical protein